MIRLPLQGRTIEAAWWGEATSERLPIVLLHEGLGSVTLWKDFPAALAAHTGRRVMAYSRFGHGASDLPAVARSTTSLHDEARLLPAVLDSAGIERAILLGHSDGGSIALVAAAEFSSRVKALILEAPHAFVEDVGLESIAFKQSLYATSDLRDRLAKYHQHVDVAFRGWCDVWLDPAFRDWNLEAELPGVACPMLLIQGVQDRYGTLAQIDAIATAVSGPVERLVLDPCGHTPHRDQRAAVLDAVARFLSPLP